MCDPVTQTALIVASTAYSLHTTRENAKAQEAAFRQAQAVEEEQMAARFGAEANERYRQARAERARLRAQSAETGAGGLSIDDLLNNVDFQAGTDIATMAGNQRNAVNSSRAELGSRLNSIAQPDYIGAGLQAGLQISSIRRPTPSGRPRAAIPPIEREPITRG